MSCPSQSLVKVSVNSVEKAAQLIRNDIKKWREEEREKEIKKYMNSNYSKICKFFGSPVTREEAENRVDVTYDIFDDYGRWRFYCSGMENDTIRFKSAVAISADGFIWLSLEDACLVKRYLDKSGIVS